jgi:hypothetical protein
MSLRARRTRGRSPIEVLLVLGLLIVIAAVAWPILKRLRSGGYPIADANDVVRTHEAMLQQAKSISGGELPRPSTVAAGSGTPDPSLDTTANLLALLIGQRSVTPAMLISRGEENPRVRVCDYDYAAVNTLLGHHWAASVRTDLESEDGVCHTSYAHLALCGERQRRWSSLADATSPLYGDRGTYRGARLGEGWTKSFVVGRYDRGPVWAGNIVFADHHVEGLTSFTSPQVTWSCGSIRPTKDNIFNCEFGQTDCTNGLRDSRVAGDAWLSITDRFEGDYSLAIDVRERLRDGSLPK